MTAMEDQNVSCMRGANRGTHVTRRAAAFRSICCSPRPLSHRTPPNGGDFDVISPTSSAPAVTLRSPRTCTLHGRRCRSASTRSRWRVAGVKIAAAVTIFSCRGRILRRATATSTNYWEACTAVGPDCARAGSLSCINQFADWGTVVDMAVDACERRINWLAALSSQMFYSGRTSRALSSRLPPRPNKMFFRAFLMMAYLHNFMRDDVSAAF